MALSRLKGFLAEHARPLFFLLMLVALTMGIRTAYFPVTHTSDTIEYIDTAKVFLGKDAPIHPNRILKPLAPLGIAAFSRITASMDSAMQEEVFIMYILLAFATYAFFFAFTQSKRRAWVGSALLLTGYPILAYGLDLYTETGALFFYVLALFTIWKYFIGPDRVWFWSSVIAITLGMFWKEYSVLSGVLFGLVILFHPSIGKKEKMKDLALLALVSGGALVLWQVHVYRFYHFSYLDWYKIGTAGDNKAREYTLYHIVKSLFATLLLAWAFVPIGLLRWKEFSTAQQRYLLLLVLPSLMFLLWGYVSSRLYYVVAPLALLFAVHGYAWLRQKSAWFAYGTVAAAVIGNFAWLFLNGAFRAML